MHYRDNLTVREKEVLSLLLQGNSNKEVGNTLEISGRTVEVHRGKIYSKLGVRNLAEVAMQLPSLMPQVFQDEGITLRLRGALLATEKVKAELVLLESQIRGILEKLEI